MDRSVEQNRESRNNPTQICPSDLCHIDGEWITFETNGVSIITVLIHKIIKLKLSVTPYTKASKKRMVYLKAKHKI